MANWTKTWTALKPIFTEEFIKRDDSAWVNALALKLRYGDSFQEHVKKINDLYDKRQTEIRPYADEFNKQQAELDRMIRERQVDETAIALQADRVEALRAAGSSPFEKA